MYSHVKQHNCAEFKEMEVECFPEANLVAMAYYLDNNNLQEHDKKIMRKQLQLVAPSAAAASKVRTVEMDVWMVIGS